MTRSMVRLLGVALLLAAALLGAVVGQAQSLTVYIEAAEAPSGQTVEIPILVKGSPGFSAMHLELTYNPGVLVVEEVEAGDLVVGEALTAFNTDEAGRVVISVAAGEEIGGDGTLAVARFLVDGEQGQTSPLGLEYPKAWEESGFDLVVDLEPGEFTVAADSTLLLLAAVACLLVLLFLLVVLLLLRGRRRRRAEAAVQPQPQPYPASPQPQQSPAPAEPGQGPKFCGNCGQALEPGKRFSIHCGHPVGG
jgi:hypothetical protein